ncbi:uncharacterized protein PGTG_20452, partial [Puccinia graminis f. sp. tritici CRL 75-36-700-3]
TNDVGLEVSGLKSCDIRGVTASDRAVRVRPICAHHELSSQRPICAHPHLSSTSDLKRAGIQTLPPFGFHQLAQESVQRQSDAPNRISSGPDGFYTDPTTTAGLSSRVGPR